MSRFLPLALFAALAGVLVWALYRPDRDALTSTLLDRPAPGFSLPRLDDEAARLSDADLRGGGPVVLNFWASWCPPCRAEHQYLEALAAMDVARVVGIAYKNEPEKARAFLARLGDPFEAVALDREGRVGIDFGVAALPETFVLDQEGVVVYKHVGPINPGDLEKKILPAVEAARR